MRQEKKISEQKAQSNSSKINPISEKIAREREIIEGREGESRIERLSRPIGAVKRNILEGIEKPTFAPKISKKSTELATKGNYFSAGRRARSSSADRSRPSRSINNDHGCVEDLMNEYLDSAGDLSEQSNEYYSRGDITDPDEAIDQKYETKLYERTNTWAKQRQDKIERDRLVRAEEQMRDCTFRPQLQKAPAQDGLVRGRDNSRRQGMHIDRFYFISCFFTSKSVFVL